MPNGKTMQVMKGTQLGFGVYLAQSLEELTGSLMPTSANVSGLLKGHSGCHQKMNGAPLALS
eukprot:2173928-Amphidinium_carterae.1